jgi:hypothetical protein
MVFVPINAKLHAKEMVQIIEDAEATAAFVSPKLADDLAGALATSAQAGCRLLRIGSADYAALFDAAPMDAPVTAPEALAWLFYTSGTTGRSKGAMLSHRNLMAMTISHLAEMETFGEDASQIHAAPMSHGSGLYIPAYVARGARQVLPAPSTRPSSSTCAMRIRPAAHSSRRPWCSACGWRPSAAGAGPRTCARSSMAARRCTWKNSRSRWPPSARSSPSCTARARRR